MRRWKSRGHAAVIFLSAVVLLFLFFVNLFVGSVDIPFTAVADILSGDETSSAAWRMIVLDSRLPQALAALFSGMALSVSGLTLQTLFNNPLAGPEVFGINSGAGLGVALVMLFMHGTFTAGAITLGGYAAMLAGAFIGALAVIVIILALSAWVRNSLFLLIAGLAVSYLTSAVITLLNYFSTAEGVHSYLIWGMGDFGGVSMEYMPFYVSLVIVLLLIALLMAKPLNALMLGDSYAANLGVRTKRIRGIVLMLTGALTAIVTAFCGPISFIGLAVPHFARLMLRTNNHLFLLPVAMFLGGAVALLCNMLCHLPGDNGLIPLSAITPIIGAPVILYVVLRDRRL